MSTVIQTEGLTKSYDNVTALQGVSLTVDDGELFGLIGPDGAGKTTLFRILTTLLLPDEGSAQVQSMDVVQSYRSIRESVGYMPGMFSLYTDLSVKENLEFFATVFGTTVDANYDLIKAIYKQLEPFQNRKAGALSGGMKQKLALSCALIHRPKVLFLDEPTTGVDPISRQDLWSLLSELSDSGITVFVSTAYMDEASYCDRIAFFQEGQVLDIDTPQHIRQDYPRPLWAVKASQVASLITDLRGHPQVHSVFPFGEYLHVAAKDEALQEEDIRKYIAEKGHKNIEVKPAEPQIEDTFMELMQANNADEQ